MSLLPNTKIPDLKGQKFNRLTVLTLDPAKTKGKTKDKAYWICSCSCGRTKSINHRCLERGQTQSCGCLNKEINSNRVPDLTGQKFGRWTVLGRNKEVTGDQVNSKQNCICECGTKKTVPTRNLLNGDSKSCGCLHSEITSKLFIKDLTGQKFGRWLVLELDKEQTKSNAAYWLCQCDCGTKKPVKGDSLSSGTSKSCGCLQKEIVAETGRAKKTHGETGTRLYRIWAGMKLRCFDPNQETYKNYGGRGITVCDVWKDSYENFRDWALNNGYTNDLTIERKNVHGNYEPDNCCFITLRDQAKNRQNTIRITAWGDTKTIGDWLLDPRCKLKNEYSIRSRYKRNKESKNPMTMEQLLGTGFIKAKVDSSVNM